mgnify:FL=1
MSDKNYTQKKNQRQQVVDNTYGHVQPQAVEAEKAVLGALLIDRDAYAVVSEILTPESFYEPRNQMMYAAIRDLAAEEKGVDIITVTDRLAKNGTLAEVGGPAYVAETSSKVATSANVEYHAKIVAEKYLARQLIAYGTGVESKAYDETNDIDDVMQEAEGTLIELSQCHKKKDYTQIDPVIAATVKNIEDAAANVDGITGVPSGYYRLDEMTAGWQPSDLIIIAARPAMGKTSFALSMAKNIAADYKVPIGFFSLEMSNEQLMSRLISNVCEIEGSKILSGQLLPDEWDRLDKQVNHLLGIPMYVDDTSGLSVFELQKKARRMVREDGVKIIIVDYLHLLSSRGLRFSNRQEEIGKITECLKNLAKELNIPIIALSQLNRGVENREGLEGKRPRLSDLRESGAIELHADVVIFVHRPEYYHIYQDDNGRDLHGMAQIIIAKHRKGATGDVLLTFRGEFTRFENPEDNQLAPIELRDSEEVPF